MMKIIIIPLVHCLIIDKVCSSPVTEAQAPSTLIRHDRESLRSTVAKDYNFSACEFANTTALRVKWLDEILIVTQNILSKHGIETWAVQGTLLGIVRDKRTMPWTWDVDIQTFSRNIPFICSPLSRSRLELESKGYRVFDCMNNFARVCKARRLGAVGPPNYIVTGEPVESRLDIYGATKRANGLYDIIFSPCQWDLDHHLFPLTIYTWDQTKAILGPYDYNYFLQYSYGINWTVPERYGGGRDDLCAYNRNHYVALRP